MSKNRTFGQLNKIGKKKKNSTCHKIIFKVLASLQIICSFAIHVNGCD
jgi:hypothetical protein